MRVIVVGASVAGVAAAVALRQTGYDGEVLLVGEERHPPYDRPPLSKRFLVDGLGVEEIALAPATSLRDAEVQQRLGTRATALDVEARTLELDGAERIPFDGLIIATGSAARRLPEQPDAHGIHLLRKLDDALALRRDLLGSERLAVIGAGFIGLEIASSARSLGIPVTVLENAPAPLARVVGPEVGSRFAALHESRGVEVRCGASVEGIRVLGGRVTGVNLVGGSPVDADVVVVGIGAAPVTEWLAGSGLEIADGVICDSTLRAAPRIYAAGDVARWRHPVFGLIRVEHWTTAGDHARAAAWNLAAELSGHPSERRAADEIPYFWSDQYDVKVQLAGWVAGYHSIHELEESGRQAVLFGRHGLVVGGMAWNWPAFVARTRRAIASSIPWHEAIT